MVGGGAGHFGRSGGHIEPFGRHLVDLGPSCGQEPRASKLCEIRIKIDREVTTLARDTPEVDIDLSFYMVFPHLSSYEEPFTIRRKADILF